MSKKRKLKYEQKNGEKNSDARRIAGVLLCSLLAGILFVVFQSFEKVDPGRRNAPQERVLTNEQRMKISSLEKSVLESPENLESWTELAHLYFDANKVDNAIRAYLKSLDLSPGNPDLLTDLGIMYQRKGQAEKAVDAFREAARKDPLHEKSRFNIGALLLRELNDEPGALQAWEDLLRINPNAATNSGKPLREAIAGLGNKD